MVGGVNVVVLPMNCISVFLYVISLESYLWFLVLSSIRKDIFIQIYFYVLCKIQKSFYTFIICI